MEDDLKPNMKYDKRNISATANQILLKFETCLNYLLNNNLIMGF